MIACQHAHNVLWTALSFRMEHLLQNEMVELTVPQYVYCVLSSSVAYNHIWASNLSSRVKLNSIFQPTLWLDANTPTTVCGPLWHSGLSSLSMRIVVANISELAIGMNFCSQIKCVLTGRKRGNKRIVSRKIVLLWIFVVFFLENKLWIFNTRIILSCCSHWEFMKIWIIT